MKREIGDGLYFLSYSEMPGVCTEFEYSKLVCLPKRNS